MNTRKIEIVGLYFVYLYMHVFWSVSPLFLLLFVLFPSSSSLVSCYENTVPSETCKHTGWKLTIQCASSRVKTTQTKMEHVTTTAEQPTSQSATPTYNFK